MADFTAQDVKKLRDLTGAGMMDAKKALVENDGDFDAAGKWLREQGLGKAAERTDRENTQGAVAVARDGNAAALVQLKCETDFVAKAPDFVALVNDLAELVAESGEGAAAERQTQIDDLKLSLKENIELGQVVRFEAAEGSVIDAYNHIQNGRGVNGVLVEVAGGSQELAHDIAVHIAFAKPGTFAARGRAGRGDRGGAGDAAQGDPERGQARGGVAEDRRGQGRRVVQAGSRRVAARAALRQGRQADHHTGPRRRPRSTRFAQVVIGG